MGLKQNQKGFTIVELLIVIVVIAILAAISIVAYTGIQNRAKTSSAQSAASNALKKINIYYAETSAYPATFSVLTGAASTDTYRLDGIAFALTLNAAPSNPATVAYQRCGVRAAGNNTAPTAIADIATNTGVRAWYWNYQNNTSAVLEAGTTTGTVGTQNVGCISTGS